VQVVGVRIAVSVCRRRQQAGRQLARLIGGQRGDPVPAALVAGKLNRGGPRWFARFLGAVLRGPDIDPLRDVSFVGPGYLDDGGEALVQDDGRLHGPVMVEDAPGRARPARRAGPPLRSLLIDRHSSPALHSFCSPLARHPGGVGRRPHSVSPVGLNRALERGDLHHRLGGQRAADPRTRPAAGIQAISTARSGAQHTAIPWPGPGCGPEESFI
jgi:hypothetical protein